MQSGLHLQSGSSGLDIMMIGNIEKECRLMPLNNESVKVISINEIGMFLFMEMRFKLYLLLFLCLPWKKDVMNQW